MHGEKKKGGGGTLILTNSPNPPYRRPDTRRVPCFGKVKRLFSGGIILSPGSWVITLGAFVCIKRGVVDMAGGERLHNCTLMSGCAVCFRPTWCPPADPYHTVDMLTREIQSTPSGTRIICLSIIRKFLIPKRGKEKKEKRQNNHMV
ncbi:unnamed protein product [Tuber aestivum]|uniref:Uncharacterized protein n=1 Tax=Tuber aestivum TaxID=59557 RepID=A0A292Q727_9PEZI|nr:unnamed protein product [Tuber aestivum]